MDWLPSTCAEHCFRRPAPAACVPTYRWCWLVGCECARACTLVATLAQASIPGAGHTEAGTAETLTRPLKFVCQGIRGLAFYETIPPPCRSHPHCSRSAPVSGLPRLAACRSVRWQRRARPSRPPTIPERRRVAPPECPALASWLRILPAAGRAGMRRGAQTTCLLLAYCAPRLRAHLSPA